jgi:N-acyl amino acid synthase of PEP-CTERM/exosortase system
MFDHAYEVILADREAARAIHQKIRYHVYCVEHQFEPHTAFPFGEEHDSWDTHAAHFIVRHRATRTWVAAVRLVLPETASFPVETLQCLKPELTPRLPRRKFAEISRICIISSSNPYKTNPHIDWNYGNVCRNGESEVLMGMMRTIIIYGLGQDIEYCYLLVNQAFARLLSRLGVTLHQVGNTIDHRGLRIPYQVNLRESAQSLLAKSAAMRALLSRRELAYRPFSSLDKTMDEIAVPMLPQHVPLVAPETAWPVYDFNWCRPGRGAWRGLA